MTQMSTVGPMFGQYVHFLRFAPPGNDYSKSRYFTQAHRVCEVIEQRLADAPLSGRSGILGRRHRHVSLDAKRPGVARAGRRGEAAQYRALGEGDR